LRRAVFLSVTCVGISSIVTQIVALREFLNVFAGNELVVGVILGNWLLLTGIGSYLGRFSQRIREPIRWLLACQTAIALLPPLQVAGIRLLKAWLLPGLVLGLGEVFLVSALLLAPYCVASGFLLTLFSRMASRQQEARQIGNVYVLDTIGDVAGGLMFSFLLVFFLNSFETVAFLMLLNLAAAALLARWSGTGGPRTARSLPFVALALVAVALLWGSDAEEATTRAAFPGQELIEQRSSAFGRLVVTRQGEQTTVYQNGLPVGSTGDLVAAEEDVHYALAQHPDPRAVLLISGGLTGALEQAAKYPLERIDLVEIDPAVLRLVRELGGAVSDPRVRLIADDARRVVRASRAEYDAILVDLPEPATAQLNRFYTLEFFEEVHTALRQGGVLSFGLTGGANYANEFVRTLGSSVQRSLAVVFGNTLVIPGAKQFFLASDAPLGYEIAGSLRRRGIATDFVRREYLRANLTPDRITAAREAVSAPAALNRDFHPVSYYAHLRYWLAQFGGGLLLPALVVAAILIGVGALVAGTPRPLVGVALGSSAFAGMGLEVVLLLAFQVCYGYVYQQIGVIVTAFLIGAAVGAFWANRRATDSAALMFRLDALLAGGALLLPPLLLELRAPTLGGGLDWVAPALFPLLNALVGFAVGAQFPVAAKLLFRRGAGAVEETAGGLYAIDLLGASVGAIVTTAFCVPLLGISGTCYLIGAIKGVSALLLRASRRTLAQPLAEVAPGRSYDPGAMAAFAVVMLIFIGLGLGIASEDLNLSLYALSFEPAYHWLLIGLLAWGIVRAMGLEFASGSGARPAGGPGARGLFAGWGDTIRRTTKVRPFRWINFLAFALLVFYPIFRCYFAIPFIFCHVCPRACAFGLLRPYAVPATLIMNLEKRSWCFHACPIGTLYDCQARTGGRPRRFRALFYVAVAALAFTAVSYFKISADLDAPGEAGSDWYTLFFKNRYSVSVIVIAVTAFMVAAAYRMRRTFCNTLCPIGTFSDLTLKLERTLARRGDSNG